MSWFDGQVHSERSNFADISYLSVPLFDLSPWLGSMLRYFSFNIELIILSRSVTRNLQSPHNLTPACVK